MFRDSIRLSFFITVVLLFTWLPYLTYSAINPDETSGDVDASKLFSPLTLTLFILLDSNPIWDMIVITFGSTQYYLAFKNTYWCISQNRKSLDMDDELDPISPRVEMNSLERVISGVTVL